MIGYILLFILVGAAIGFFLDEKGAYFWIGIITIGWAFIMGPWAIAAFIELVLGYSIASAAKEKIAI
jgi:hypothetical protein